MMKSLLPRSMTLAALALWCSQAQAETLQTGKDVEAPTAKWEGVALGFEPPQPGLLGDMLGIRPILEDHGFHYNLGYLSQLSYNAGGGYNHDKQASYIDQFSLTFSQDLQALTGIPDAAIEGNIVNRNHDNNLTRDRLQDPRVGPMFMGLTIANIGGVPAATWLGETIGWRMSFLATAGLGVIAMLGLWFSLPKGSAGARPDVKRELSVLVRPQVLSALLTTVLGAGAMFTLYTYISPVLQHITDATPLFVTSMLVLIGVGFSIGNYLGGKFADRSESATLKGFLLLLVVIMLVIPFLARSEIGAAVSMVIWGAATFAVVPPLQMRVMRVASEAPGLSSSVNIGAFNLGNALGAAAGGAVVSAGLGYSFVPVMGAIIAGLALLLVLFTHRQAEKVAYASN